MANYRDFTEYAVDFAATAVMAEARPNRVPALHHHSSLGIEAACAFNTPESTDSPS